MPAADRPGVVNSGNPGRPFRAYTPVQMVFRSRLQSLVAKKQQYRVRLQPGDWRMRLLDKALYSTYRDCVALDIGEEAASLLGLRRQPEPS